VLVGPEHKIRPAAREAGVSIDDLRLVTAPHSHAAAEIAARMASAHAVHALMKGSLHSSEMLSAAVAKENGLRTERRIIHVYAMDVPNYRKLLVVTDAAINIAPMLDEKRDICQNAVDLLHTLCIEQPLVAVLAA